MGTFSLLMLVVGLAIGAIVGLATRKPDIFRVERRSVIKAPAEALFARINDLRAWQAWSPWQRKDPAMRQVYSGPDAGLGATQAWEGNAQVGKGMMTIIESDPVHRVALRLAFEKPFKATNIVEFTLVPVGDDTEVIWSMHGPANLMTKIMDLLMNMDRMCGRDFEAGLANLKASFEGNPA